jgi:pimeloyl-ACP methyl ester carboxylesterase
MSKALLTLVAATACSRSAPIDIVEAAPAEVTKVELPSTLTCGEAAPALSMLYVGNHNSLQTACQGDGATTVIVLSTEFPVDMTELASRYRVIVPDLRGYELGVIEHLDEYVQDLVMLIRKTSNRPVIVIGHDAGGAELARLLDERHPEVIDRSCDDRRVERFVDLAKHGLLCESRVAGA